MGKLRDLLPESFGSTGQHDPIDLSSTSMEDLQKITSKMKGNPDIVKKANELMKDIGANPELSQYKKAMT